jgi:hypothetical protein
MKTPYSADKRRGKNIFISRLFMSTYVKNIKDHVSFL